MHSNSDGKRLLEMKMFKNTPERYLNKLEKNWNNSVVVSKSRNLTELKDNRLNGRRGNTSKKKLPKVMY